MKKFTAVLSLVALLSFSAHAQKEMIFKISYLPGKVYKTELTTITNMEMDFKGDEQMMENIKASGMKLPMLIESTQTMHTTTKTSQRNKDGLIPLSITYDKFHTKQKMGDREQETPNPFENVRIEALADPRGKVSIDSIYGDLAPEVKQTIELMMQQMQEQIAFPKHALKVGDEFTQELPISIPIGAAPMKIVVTMKYKLTNLTKQNALFDIVQDVTLDMPDVNAFASGSGTGKLTFDLAIMYPTVFDSNLNMELKLTKDGMDVIAKSKTTILQKASIQ